MLKTVRFTSTKLTGTGKRGILKARSDGYREFPVGGLNAYNSAGEFYTLKGAEDLFRDSSILMRRVSKGVLKSELGHPKKLPGMTDDDYLERILTIEETNVCAHIKELWLDHEYGKKHPEFKNPSLVGIMALLIPSGPHAAALEASFMNPDENIGFSIRGLTTNTFDRGRCIRTLTTIVNFDQVVEQGIPLANKYDAPSLESVDTRVTVKQLQQMVDKRASFAMESTREMAIEALRASIAGPSSSKSPIYTGW